MIGVLALALADTPPAAARTLPALAATDLPAHHVREASRRFGIPERWIKAVIAVESAGISRATSSAGAMGLMQVMPATWRALTAHHALGSDPYDPRASVLAGTAYLREMLDRYGVQGFLAAYNAGPGRYEQYLFEGRPLPAETRAYVARLAPVVDPAAATAAALVAPPRQPARMVWTRSGLFAGRSAAPGGPEAAPLGIAAGAFSSGEDALFVVLSRPARR